MMVAARVSMIVGGTAALVAGLFFASSPVEALVSGMFCASAYFTAWSI